jgi:hypothetical protein
MIHQGCERLAQKTHSAGNPKRAFESPTIRPLRPNVPDMALEFVKLCDIVLARPRGCQTYLSAPVMPKPAKADADMGVSKNSRYSIVEAVCSRLAGS